jgi:hypothetical protein
MSRPPLEVADLVRAAGDAFIERNRQWIRWAHVKWIKLERYSGVSQSAGPEQRSPKNHLSVVLRPLTLALALPTICDLSVLPDRDRAEP